ASSAAASRAAWLVAAVGLVAAAGLVAAVGALSGRSLLLEQDWAETASASTIAAPDIPYSRDRLACIVV
ncbi:MAG TPA: hypothetical protein PLQ29_07845, partial [Spirochaetales bacterium]|nr:hypothetical protein [Spirochaetales bacterium]